MSPPRARIPIRLSGKEGRYITTDQGKSWSGNFRRAHPKAVRAHYFGKTKLLEVLNQKGCVGLRMYHAIDLAGTAQLVSVGVSGDGADLVRGLILDTCIPCPSYCDRKSPLNRSAGGASGKAVPVKFTGREGSYIPIAQASQWTGNFRRANRGAVRAHFFGKAKLIEIVNQKGCVGIRIYRGTDLTGAAQLIVVGVASNGGDLTLGLVLDGSISCPSICADGRLAKADR